MSQELVAKIRKAREFRVPIKDGQAVIAKRPTDVEMVTLQGQPYHMIGSSHVVGWEGWTENDVIGGGGSDAVPFTPALWAEIYADRTDLWEPISAAIIDAYRRHAETVKARAKN